MTPETEAAVFLAATEAAATRLCSIVARSDCVKVLTIHHRYAEARLLAGVDDETFGQIVARGLGPAKGPKTPLGRFFDPDEKPKGATA